MKHLFSALRITLLAAAPVSLPAQQADTAEIIAPTRSIAEGDTVQLRAIARDSSGREIAGVEFRWFSRTPNTAAVLDNGSVIGLEVGNARIGAFGGGGYGEVHIEVAPLPPVAVTMSLPRETLYVGASMLPQVEALNRVGRPRRNVNLNYRSSAPNVARVDDFGRITALRPGRARIEAVAGKASGSATVRVVASPITSLEIVPRDTSVRTGDVVRFQARPRAGARAVANPYVEWSTAGEAASMYSDGGFVAEKAGTYVVTALVGGREARATVVVSPRQTSKRQFKQVGRAPFRDVHTSDLLIFNEGGKTWSYVPSWGSDALYIYDTSNPTNPILTDSVKVDARVINDVTITPDHKYAVMTREGASSRKNGIVILDTSDPAHPKSYSEYTETVSGGVHNAWTEGYYVFLTDDATGSMRVIDIHDPKQPKEVARWQVNREGGRALHDVIVQDGLAYLSYGYDGLVVLDVGAGIRAGSPTKPMLVTQYKSFEGEFWTHTAWRYRNYVIVGDELFPPGFAPDEPTLAYGYFHIIDVSDWDKPKEVAKYEIPSGGSHNVWTEGDTLYVGYYQAGLRALDLAGELRGDLVAQGREIAAFLPMDPRGKIPNFPFVWGPQVHNGLVYATDFNSGLWIMKLETPAPVP